MNQSPPQFSTMEFAAAPTAPRCARVFTRSILDHWGFKELTETAELLVSELVTNALRATGSSVNPRAWRGGEVVALIHVRLYGSDQAVIIEVADVDSSVPVPRHVTTDAESGRGLFLVEAMSRRWSYYRPPTGGKVVWCEIALPAQASG